MRRLAMPEGYTSGSAETINRAGFVAQFSPDGKRFTVLLRRGDLRHNSNNYSLLLFETSHLFRSANPKLLLEMSSSSNRPAIRSVKWLRDGARLAFLGEGPGETPQVYILNVFTKQLRKMTHHATPVVAYDIDEQGSTIVFEAEPSVARPVGKIEHQGIVVTTQGLDELLAQNRGPYVPSWTLAEELYVRKPHQSEKNIPLADLMIDSLPPLVSPRGRYALLRVLVRKVPTAWAEYKDEHLHKLVEQSLNSEIASPIQQYLLLDIATGKSAPLLNTPSSVQNAGAAWAWDEKSVAVSGAYYPLEGTQDAQRSRLSRNTYVLEISIPQRRIVEITDRPASILRWLAGSKRIILELHDQQKNAELALEKHARVWKDVTGRIPPEKALARPEVTLEEDLNIRPKIFVTNPASGQKALLLDLNPEFDQLELASAKRVQWQAADGHWVEGALFLPPDYTPSIRYPLVIQTHGFVNGKFYVDGPWSSAFAARPLACQGIVVLQVGYATANDDAQFVNTTMEGPRAMAVLEGALDFLDRTGVIDRSRVGIIAFSRTVYEVSYTLTHSSYRFAAVTLADGFDGGYLQYLAYPQSPLVDAAYVNGGPPVGNGLQLWLRNSPEFNLDKVHSPVRLEAYGRLSLISGWERFSMLSHLGRPVDYVYIPGGIHILVKPWHRNVSQQGNVDWFTFWLKGEVDPDPEKRGQYDRWFALRQRPESSLGEAEGAAPVGRDLR